MLTSTLGTTGNGDRMLQNKFLAVCKCPGGQDTINCQMSALRTHCATNAQGLPRGMLVAEIDSHIISGILKCGLRTQNVVRYSGVCYIGDFTHANKILRYNGDFVISGSHCIVKMLMIAVLNHIIYILDLIKKKFSLSSCPAEKCHAGGRIF